MNCITRLRALGVVVLLVAGLSACAGDGSSGSAALSPIAQLTASPAGPATRTNVTANGKLIIQVPPARRGSRNIRRPAYISPGTTRAAIFIDGATTPAGSTTSCTSSGCTIAWSAALGAPAAHSFAVEIDDGTNVLAENAHTYAIALGNNGTLAPTLTLNGVAAAAALTAETCTGSTCTGSLALADAAGNAITNSGSNPNFDNGTITVSNSPTGTGTVASGGTIATVSATGTYAYTMTCAASSGQFQTNLTASIPAGSGDITSAELSNRSLSYPSAINGLEYYRCTTANAILPAHVYVSTQAGTILVFAGNLSGTVNAVPIATIAGSNTGLSNPLGITVDSSGLIYVANNSGSGGLLVFAANPSGTLNEAPIATIAGAATQLNGPSGVGLDASGRIYASNYGNNSITVYAASPSGTMNEAPLASISGSNTGLNNPEGIGFDSSGRIYTADANIMELEMFAANPTGALNEAPLAAITGSNTGLATNNYGIAIDSGGKIYAPNLGSTNSVTYYPANPSGTTNETPTGTITGSNTGLSSGVYRVGVDSNGKIYAGLQSSVIVFSGNPIGTLNETPLCTIAGSNTGLTGAYVSGIVIH